MATDKASYRNRGGILQRLVTAYKRFRYFSRAGSNLVVKRSAEFRMVKQAVLEVGSNVTIQDYSFFQLTMPEPKVLRIFYGIGTSIEIRSPDDALSHVIRTAVLERYELSLAYPIFIGVMFASVTVGGMVFFGEPVTAMRLFAVLLIFMGIIAGTR